MLIVLTGGARSGKSNAAIALATQHRTDKQYQTQVTFIATAEAKDDEMAQRVASHRAQRPKEWMTIEAKLDLVKAVNQVNQDDTLIIDCFGMWVTNQMFADIPLDSAGTLTDTAANGALTDIVNKADQLAITLHERPGLSLIVTNEVGSGVVPHTSLGRKFRDILGAANQAVTRHADAAYLVVAGKMLTLHQQC